MAKTQITINNFVLFCELIKSVSKIIESAKFQINEAGVEIYGVRAPLARCEISSNSVISSIPVEFSIENLNMFVRTVLSVKDAHDGDFSGLKFIYDNPFVRFESKRMKIKFGTQPDDIISKWISKKLEIEMTPEFEFTSTSDFVKRVNSHSFMFSDPKDMRVYIETRDDMENNAVFATLGNKETNLNNEITIKFGIVNAGSLIKNDIKRNVILDLARLNLYNSMQSNEIKFSLMDKDVLVGKTEILETNGIFAKIIIYGTLLKN